MERNIVEPQPNNSIVPAGSHSDSESADSDSESADSDSESADSDSDRELVQKLHDLKRWTEEDQSLQSGGAPPSGSESSVSVIEEVCGNLEEANGPACQGDVVVGAVGSTSPDEPRLRVLLGFGGPTGCALLDTGATFSMITDEWVNANDLQYYPQPESSFSGFGGDNRVRILGTIELSPSVSHLQLKSQTFKVIDTKLSGDIPIILGTDFIRANKLILDTARAMLKQVSANGREVEVYLGGDGKYTTLLKRFPCYAKSETKLSPNQLTYVSLTSKISNEISLFEGEHNNSIMLVEDENCSKGWSILPGVVDTTTSIGVYVSSSSSHSIKQGSRVGSITSMLVLSAPEDRSVLLGTTDTADEKEQTTVDWKKIGDQLDHLSTEGKNKVMALLKSHEGVFSTGDDDIGLMGLTEHQIRLSDDTPIYQKPRRLPDPVSREIDAQCEELQLLDIIEPSSSPWSSPVVPVRKKDGSIRLCIDYRRLNAVTVPDRFPLPNLTDAVFGLSGAKYFSSLDLVRGYYQLPLAAESRPITAFSTPRGHFQFKRLSFGLRNAPGAFQREMTRILDIFPHDRVIVYIDDVLIISNSLEEHEQLVSKVLATLEAHGVKIKPGKCTWFASEVEYLGHVVGAGGIRKSDKFVEQIRDAKRPETIKQLREFLGLANFQRKFVPNFSMIQKPLSEKLRGRGSRKLQWTDDMDDAFEAIKQKLQEDVILSYPDYSDSAAPLQLYVDASGVGAGACLCQEQDGETRIIAYSSTTFGSVEANYSTIERELSALRWGVKTFRPFLIGGPFIIHTDHQPLIYLHNMNLVDSRLARTIEDLSDFNYTIRYTPGSQNGAADCLSRLYSPEQVHHVGIDLDGQLPEGVEVHQAVPGGGDSLIDSLCWLLKREFTGEVNLTNVQLRNTLVDELLKYPEVYGLNLDRLARKKLRLMRHAGQLPGVEIIFAFARLYNCVVLVHFGGQVPIGYCPPDTTEESLTQVHLQCLGGVHYNPAMVYKKFSRDWEARQLRPGFIPSKGLPNLGPDDTAEVEEAGEGPEVLLSDLVVRPSIDGSAWCPQGRHFREHDAAIIALANGEPFCALLDTGAQTNCITQSVLKQLGVNADSSLIYNMIGFGGRGSKSIGTATIEIKLSGMSGATSTSFVVVKDEIMPYCMVLGIDFMKEIKLIFDYGSEYLTKDGVNLERIVPVDGSSESRVPPVLAVEPHLPPDNNEGERNPVSFQLQRNGLGKVIGLESLLTEDSARRHQQLSKELRKLRGFVERNERALPRDLKEFAQARRFLVIKDGVLCYRAEGEPDIFVVSSSLITEMSLSLHYNMAHLGRQKLIEVVRRNAWHPSISRVAADITKSCDLCQRMKVHSSFAPPMLRVTTRYPFEMVAVDLVALEPVSGYNCCLVAIDHYTKWLAVVPLRRKTSAAVATAFETRVLPQLVSRPHRILSDNGGEFSGREFNEMLEEYGIQHVYTTPNKPSSNGLVERTNRSLLQSLKVQGRQDQVSWLKVLPKVVMIHNQSHHSGIGTSPMEFLLATSHVVTSGEVLPRPDVEKWKEGHPSFGSFKVGQLVLWKNVFKGNEVKNKLRDRYKGPYSVSKVNGNGTTYEIEDSGSNGRFKAHHVQLKAYHIPPKYLTAHPSYHDVVKGRSTALYDSEEEDSLSEQSESDDEEYSVGLPYASDDEFSDPPASIALRSEPRRITPAQGGSPRSETLSEVALRNSLSAGNKSFSNPVGLSTPFPSTMTRPDSRPIWDETRLLAQYFNPNNTSLASAGLRAHNLLTNQTYRELTMGGQSYRVVSPQALEWDASLVSERGSSRNESTERANLLRGLIYRLSISGDDVFTRHHTQSTELGGSLGSSGMNMPALQLSESSPDRSQVEPAKQVARPTRRRKPMVFVRSPVATRSRTASERQSLQLQGL